MNVSEVVRGLMEDQDPSPQTLADTLLAHAVHLDENRNAAGEPVISADQGHVQVRVIATDEDVIIAKAVFLLLAATQASQHTRSEE